MAVAVGRSGAGEQHIEAMKELYRDYQRRGEPEAVASQNALLTALRDQCASREGSVKELIQGLCRLAESTESTSAYPEAHGAHSRRLAAVQRNMAQQQQEAQQADGDARALEQQRSTVQTRFTEAKDAGAAEQQAAADEELALRHLMSLYAHISNITWRLGSRGADGAVAGTVSDPATGDLRAIDLDPRKMSRFDLVNSLWELV